MPKYQYKTIEAISGYTQFVADGLQALGAEGWTFVSAVKVVRDGSAKMEVGPAGGDLHLLQRRVSDGSA